MPRTLHRGRRGDAELPVRRRVPPGRAVPGAWAGGPRARLRGVRRGKFAGRSAGEPRRSEGRGGGTRRRTGDHRDRSEPLYGDRRSLLRTTPSPGRVSHVPSDDSGPRDGFALAGRREEHLQLRGLRHQSRPDLVSERVAQRRRFAGAGGRRYLRRQRESQRACKFRELRPPSASRGFEAMPGGPCHLMEGEQEEDRHSRRSPFHASRPFMHGLWD